ncbi:MAG: hypothetical protein PHV34_06035 [Verrucomicrobiae bacterium]|nr:hypothetical protein [Verrucomicrobiae bacterium]
MSGETETFSFEKPIPSLWRKSVCGILRAGVNDSIFTTFQADRDWAAAFPDAWDYDRFDAIIRALEAKEAGGRQIMDMDEDGETYAFWFHFRGKKIYGKINLLPNRKMIILYSSHTPRKGEENL